jgi:hypothetical protein
MLALILSPNLLSEKRVIIVVLAPLVGGVFVRDPYDDGDEHPL